MSDAVVAFNCPHCSQYLDAPADMAGEAVPCPACGQAIAIPAPAPAAPAEPAPAPGSAPAAAAAGPVPAPAPAAVVPEFIEPILAPPPVAAAAEVVESAPAAAVAAPAPGPAPAAAAAASAGPKKMTMKKFTTKPTGAGLAAARAPAVSALAGSKKMGMKMPAAAKSAPALAAKLAPVGAPRAAGQAGPKPAAAPGAVSEKRRLVALLLCLFCGTFSLHRFYVGKVSAAVIQLACVWLGQLINTYFIMVRKASPAVGVLICILFCGSVLLDLIMIIAGKFTDKQKLPLKNW